MVTTMGRKTGGKRKIEIKPIAKEEARQVCFSKRRRGLFKKANEISILCGTEVAALVFSRAGKVFTCGNPDADSVINRFMNITDQQQQQQPSSSSSSTSTTSSSNTMMTNDIAELSKRLIELDSLIEKERRRQIFNDFNQEIVNNIFDGVNLEEVGLEKLLSYEKMLINLSNQMCLLDNSK